MAIIPAIPASQIVSVIPSVLAAGGNAQDLIGIFLTQNTRVPYGQLLSFPTSGSVAAYFGSSSNEAALAAIYFLGFDNSNKKPAFVAFSQYNTASISAYLRGGKLSLTLTQLQALNGFLSITIDGAVKSGNVNFGSASSFSSAAQLISSTLSLGTGAVVYDSISGAFTVSSASTGSGSTIGYGSGVLAGSLLLTQALGAVTSQGAPANTLNTGAPITFMNNLILQSADWATFTTVWEPSDTDKISFATWTNSQNNQYMYAMWDTNILDTQAGGPSVPATTITSGNFSGTAIIYSNPSVDTMGGQLAAFLMGAVASIDFTQHNGRATMAFKRQTGLLPHILDAASSNYLNSYGIDSYRDYTTANQAFTWFYPGAISGPFLWIDSYVNQIWLNNQLQLALMVLLDNVKSLPYNMQGYGLVQAVCLDPILAAVNFGAIAAGIPLSQAQIAEVNSAAGLNIDQILSQRGWYLQILPASPQVRQARGSPPITLWYTDGQAIQKINLASIDVL